MRVITARPGQAVYYDPFEGEAAEGEIDQSNPVDPQTGAHRAVSPPSWWTTIPHMPAALKWTGYRGWLPEHKDPTEEVAKQYSPSILNDMFYEIYGNFGQCFKHQRNIGNPDPYTGCKECAERGDFGGLIVTKAQREGNLALDWVLSNMKDPSSAVNPEIAKTIAEGSNNTPGIMETIRYIKADAPKTVQSFVHSETKQVADTVMGAAAGAGTGIIDGLVGSPGGLGGAYDAATSAVQDKLGVDLSISDKITGGMVLAAAGLVLLLLIIKK